MTTKSKLSIKKNFITDSPIKIAPIEGKTYLKDELRKLIFKSFSQTTFDVACVIKYFFNGLLVACPQMSINKYNWYEFTGHKWSPVSLGKLRLYLAEDIVIQYQQLLKSIKTQLENEEDDQLIESYESKIKSLNDLIAKLKDESFAHKFITACSSIFEQKEFLEQLNSNPHLVGFENGVYNLETGQFRAGLPEDLISFSTGINYQTFSEEELVPVVSFITQIFPEEETSQYILTFLASCLLGMNPQEKFHIWTGVGGNGKSKLLELFEKSCGQYAGKISSKIFTQSQQSNSSAASPEIACLKGLRFVSAQEPDDKKNLKPTINTGIMKELTGGDKIITRALYGDPFTFKPQFKIVFCSNHLPDLSADDEGAWRRLSVVQFKSRFIDNPKYSNEFPRDYHLSEKIENWKEMFMYLLLTDFYPLYKKNGLIEPDSVIQATKQYRANVDDIKDFIDQTIEPIDGHYVTLKDLWNKYKKSDFYSKDQKMKDFKIAISNKLGIEIPEQKKIDNIRIRSPILGWEFINDSDEVVDNINNGESKL